MFTIFLPYINFDKNEEKKYIGNVYNFEGFYRSFFVYYYGLINEKGYMFIDNETENNNNFGTKETNEYILYSKHPFTNMKNTYIKKE